jgi:hypothetical protein
MATFSRGLIQGLINPAYSQNLRDVGMLAGSAPGRRRRQRMLTEMIDRPVDLANFAVSEAARAGDPTAMLRATQARDSVIKDRTQQSLNQLEVSRLAAGTPEQKMQIEKIMERVAAGAGIDASKISGRTQAELDTARSKQRQAISDAYFALDADATVKNADGEEVSVISQFERNVEKAGFGAFFSKLKTERARQDKFNADIEAEEESLRSPLPIKSTRDALEKLAENEDFPPAVKQAFDARLNGIEQPDFDSGETWSSITERRRARETLTVIDGEILRYTIRQETEKADRIDALEREIRRVEKIDTSKGLNPNTQGEAAIKSLKEQDPPAFGTELEFFQGAPEIVGGEGFTKVVPLEPDLSKIEHREMIEARATKLAQKAAEDQKSQTLSALRSELAALQEPAKKGDKKKNNDVETGADTSDVMAKADAIIGG